MIDLEFYKQKTKYELQRLAQIHLNECYELECDFFEIKQGMEGHEEMEASLMQVEHFPKLLFSTIILVMKS